MPTLPILDDAGEPRLFFHGTYREIRKFSAERHPGVGGAYFAITYEDAADLAVNGCMEEGDAPTVMTVHLYIENPFRMTGSDSHLLSLDRIAELKAMGYDGVIGSIEGGEEFEYVAFDPDQIQIISCEIVPQSSPRP